MRWIKKSLAASAVGVALGSGFFSGPALADQGGESVNPAEYNTEMDQDATYEPEGDVFLGYRFATTKDSLKAAEYIYPESSLVLGLNYLAIALPHRYHVNGELVGEDDFYLDGGFAYKDTVLLRNVLVGVRHNLNHYNYDFAGEVNPLYTLAYTERDPGDSYYTNFVSNLLSLRLKAPDFPLHAFVNHRHVEKDSRVQQRFLLGYFTDTEKVSETRSFSWRSNAIKLGANSHLGPLEIEYAFDQARFDPGGGNILYDYYPEYTGSPSRAADYYPHNVVAKTESAAHTVRVHSSYTGSVVTGATFSNLFQKNNYSKTESSISKGAFDFSWIPRPAIGVFFNYRHINVDKKTPDSFTLYNRDGDSINTYSVRQGVSYYRDVISLSSRFKPMKLLSLYANYEYSQTERSDEENWLVLPDRSAHHTVVLKANARPADRFRMTAEYEYKNYDTPSFNSIPDRSNLLRLTTTYVPTPIINIYLEYLLSVTERDRLRYYINTDPPDPDILEEGSRDGRRDQVLASVTTVLTPKATFALSWYFQRWKVDQDLVYGKQPDDDPPYFLDSGVRYSDRSNTFALSFQYIPRDDLSISTDLSHTLAWGKTGYNAVVTGTPFSNLKTVETGFSLNIAKKFYDDWEIGIRGYLGFYEDKITDLMDGKVYSSSLLLKRYF